MLRTLALALVLGTAAIAEAQGATDEEARANFEAGRIAFADARFADALPYFERAYELSHRPELLYNIGVCRDRLGHDAEALEAFEGYLAALPDAENRVEVEQRIATARERVARAEADVTPRSETSTDPTGWILFASGLAVLVAGGVLLGVGVAERSAVEGSMGTLSWTDATARVGTADALSIAGAIGLGVGAALGSLGLVLALGQGGSESNVTAELGPTHVRLSW